MSIVLMLLGFFIGYSLGEEYARRKIAGKLQEYRSQGKSFDDALIYILSDKEE